MKPEEKHLKWTMEIDDEELDGVTGGTGAPSAGQTAPSPSPQPSIPSIPPDPGLMGIQKAMAEHSSKLPPECGR